MPRKRKSVQSIIDRRFRNPKELTPKRSSTEKPTLFKKAPVVEKPKAKVESKVVTKRAEPVAAVTTAAPVSVPHISHPQPAQRPYATPSVGRQWQDVPWTYGDNMIYLLIRDPYWVYSYWEITKEHEEKHLQLLGGDRSAVKTVLRVYDVTNGDNNPPFFDIALQDMADHWFINVGANRSYFVEIGLLHRDGRFIMLARSNRITTPRDSMSDVLDEHWMGIDFDKLYALSGGFELGKSSMELKKLMQERLQKAITSGSGAISSFSSPVKLPRNRGFWFVLDCELIVYGATEPDAKVTLQGKEMKLRPDGTFSARFALPDGRIVLDAVATSADGVEERKIIPVVERKTSYPDPVMLKHFDTEKK